MMTKEQLETGTNWRMTYEQYVACYCPNCNRENCPQRDAFRRVPEIDGGLGLCPSLKSVK